MEKKPTKAQLRLAARIYGLAILAETDSPNPGELGSQIRSIMSNIAYNDLMKYGIHSGDVLDEEYALKIAMQLKP